MVLPSAHQVKRILLVHRRAVEVFVKIVSYIDITQRIDLRIGLLPGDAAGTCLVQQLDHRGDGWLPGITKHPVIVALAEKHLFNVDEVAAVHLPDIAQAGLFAKADVRVQFGCERLVQVAFLRSDDDYAITGPGAPDRSGCGILEHRDAFDIVRVNVIQAAFVRKIVQHDQRCLRAADGTQSLI